MPNRRNVLAALAASGIALTGKYFIDSPTIYNATKELGLYVPDKQLVLSTEMPVQQNRALELIIDRSSISVDHNDMFAGTYDDPYVTVRGLSTIKVTIHAIVTGPFEFPRHTNSLQPGNRIYV